MRIFIIIITELTLNIKMIKGDDILLVFGAIVLMGTYLYFRSLNYEQAFNM
jgi:hypothetical protein